MLVASVALLVFRSSTRTRIAEPAPPEPESTDSFVPRRPTALPSLPPLPDDPAGKAAAADESVTPEQRLARAKHTLDSYLLATRYPPQSRPMREHPDLAEPHHVEPVTLPLARKDRAVTDAKVELRQDRMFLAGDETAKLEILCSNSSGPMPCTVVSSRVVVPPSEAKGPRAAHTADLPFQAESPGTKAVALLQPRALGFGEHQGTLRVDVELRIGSESGGASFDVQYASTAPARFTGAVREELTSGSLDLVVGLDVAEAGRYVLSARVDDADDRTFAYVTFNDELRAGPNEVRLRVFGKLVHDESAKSPFRLRDLEGFVLRENVHPDRAPMPTLSGVVHTTKAYDAAKFSDAVWESPDKKRHVDELQKDVDELQREVERSNP